MTGQLSGNCLMRATVSGNLPAQNVRKWTLFTEPDLQDWRGLEGPLKTSNPQVAGSNPAGRIEKTW
jgi:hypothetical protein